MVAAPVMAQPACEGCGKDTSILGNGMFECRDGAFKVPIITDTNFDSLTVGKDIARSFGWDGFFPFRNKPTNAENDLNIVKNQHVGPCEPCHNSTSAVCNNCTPCQDSCTTVNIENVHVGDRIAQAFGSAVAKNKENIVLNQGI